MTLGKLLAALVDVSAENMLGISGLDVKSVEVVNGKWINISFDDEDTHDCVFGPSNTPLLDSLSGYIVKDISFKVGDIVTTDKSKNLYFKVTKIDYDNDMFAGTRLIVYPQDDGTFSYIEHETFDECALYTNIFNPVEDMDKYKEIKQ